MCDQRRPIIEFATALAAIMTFVDVMSLVVLEARLEVDAALTTLLTGIRIQASMGDHVTLQHLLTLEYLLALWTFVGLGLLVLFFQVCTHIVRGSEED